MHWSVSRLSPFSPSEKWNRYTFQLSGEKRASMTELISS